MAQAYNHWNWFSTKRRPCEMRDNNHDAGRNNDCEEQGQAKNSEWCGRWQSLVGFVMYGAIRTYFCMEWLMISIVVYFYSFVFLRFLLVIVGFVTYGAIRSYFCIERLMIFMHGVCLQIMRSRTLYIVKFSITIATLKYRDGSCAGMLHGYWRSVRN